MRIARLPLALLAIAVLASCRTPARTGAEVPPTEAGISGAKLPGKLIGNDGSTVITPDQMIGNDGSTVILPGQLIGNDGSTVELASQVSGNAGGLSKGPGQLSGTGGGARSDLTRNVGGPGPRNVPGDLTSAPEPPAASTAPTAVACDGLVTATQEVRTVDRNNAIAFQVALAPGALARWTASAGVLGVTSGEEFVWQPPAIAADAVINAFITRKDGASATLTWKVEATDKNNVVTGPELSGCGTAATPIPSKP